jgi:hypothetical protein
MIQDCYMAKRIRYVGFYTLLYYTHFANTLPDKELYDAWRETARKDWPPESPHIPGAQFRVTPKQQEAIADIGFEKTKRLLDGSWESEAQFLVMNIALKAK